MRANTVSGAQLRAHESAWAGALLVSSHEGIYPVLRLRPARRIL